MYFLLPASCFLPAACCLLLAACCLLHAACCLLLAACFLLLAAYYLLLITYSCPLATYHLPLTTYCLLPTTYHSLLTTYHLPRIPYHLLLTNYHLPLTTYHLLQVAEDLAKWERKKRGERPPDKPPHDKEWMLAGLYETHRRRYLLRSSAIELFFRDKPAVFLNLFKKNRRRKMLSKLSGACPRMQVLLDS